MRVVNGAPGVFALRAKGVSLSAPDLELRSVEDGTRRGSREGS